MSRVSPPFIRFDTFQLPATISTSLCLFCSGNPRMEPGAVVCRVSPAFIRFGTFQLPSTRGPDDLPLVQQLADYTIRHHYAHLEGQSVARH